MSYSVVIPTMGRKSLNDAIDSVLNQTYPASEIIVVAGKPPSLSEKNLHHVKIIENFQENNSVWTAAHNRNVGVRAAKSDFIAFLDDDDSWKPEKMQAQINFLKENPGYVSLSSAVYKVRPWLKYRRPFRLLKSDQDVLFAHYGKLRYFPTPYYTPTPGIVVPAKIAKQIPFDEVLLGFEDTWWLHNIQKQNYKIHQLRRALTIVNANPVRSISRDSLNKNIAWAKKLAEVDILLASNYFRGICLRNALVGRRWHDVKFYLKPEMRAIIESHD